MICATQLAAQEASLAEQIFQRYQDLLLREDVYGILPAVLIELKKQENQPLLTPATITTVLDDPDILKGLIPDLSDEFVTLLKEDTDIQTMLSDPAVQTLLQDPEAIDELASLLEIEPSISTVSITPASITSPDVGEQFTISVDIANAQNVAGYQITLQFDSEAVRYILWEQGTYLEGALFDVPPKIGTDEITLASTAQVASGTVEGTLLTITFEVVAVKTSALSLTEVTLASGSGISLPVTTQNAEIVEPKPAWDVNKDGVINILDLTLVAAHFGETGTIDADVNGDNIVNILDLTLVATHFGE